jgi:hypothetical protein
MKHQIQNNSDRIQAVPGYAAFNPGEIRTFTKEDAEILKANPYLTEVQRGGAETSEEDESVKEEKPKGQKRKTSI